MTLLAALPRLALSAPGWVVVGAAGAVVVTALHFLSWRRPPAQPLPTARFIPERAADALARTVRLTDVRLLLLRLALLAAVTLALAGVTLMPERAPRARVVLADLSRAVRDRGEVVRAVDALRAPGTPVTVVAFGAQPAVLDSAAFVTLAASDVGMGRGALSAAMILALRAAEPLHEQADTVELVVVSPLVREEADGATAPLARLWPGPIVHVAVAAATVDSAPASPVDVRTADVGDPLRAAFALLGPVPGGGNVRIARDAVGAADEAWLRVERGRVLLDWPADGVPRDWTRQAVPDSVAGLVTAGATAVLKLARASRPALDTSAVAVAWWIDGSAAAIERTVADGCVRAVGVAVPAVGDAALTASFARVLRELVVRCGGRRDLRPADAMLLGRIAPANPDASVERAAVEAPRTLRRGRSLAPWLLALALLLALLELPLRARIGRRRSAQLLGDDASMGSSAAAA